MKNLTIKIFVLLLILSSAHFAQSEPDTNANVQSVNTELEMQKSPWGAVLRSAIIPGWGQFYNESYWKIPLFWGVMGSFVYGWFYYDDFYRDARDDYNQSLLTGGNSRLKTLRDFYRDERDLFTIYFALAYVLNLIDAYVDAHLFDFDVSENPLTRTRDFTLKINF